MTSLTVPTPETTARSLRQRQAWQFPAANHLPFVVTSVVRKSFLAGKVLTVVLGCGAFTYAHAAKTCTNADYSGIYAFSSVGFLLQLPPEGAALLGTISQSGRFLPDGKGSLFIETNASYNGIVLKGDIPATYSVTPDCIVNFDLVLPFPLSAPSKFQGVLSSDNRQMSLLLTEPSGTVIRGLHVKQDLRFCTTPDFSGSYSIDLYGTTNSPKNLAGRFQRIGRIDADGEGHFKASTTANYNGRVVKEDFTGDYSVNARCYVTLKYIAPAAAGSENIVINGAIGGHGEVVQMMILTDGWGVGGSLLRQQQ